MSHVRNSLTILLLLSCTIACAQSAPRLTYLSGRLDAEELAELKTIAPNVDFLVDPAPADALARAVEIDGADAHMLDASLLAAAANLRWVQAWSAGVDRYLEIEGLRENDRIVLTNMQGVHGPAIAEHVFATVLALTRRLPQLAAAQRSGDWDRNVTPIIILSNAMQPARPSFASVHHCKQHHPP